MKYRKYQNTDNISFVNLSETVGILPPQARGCEDAMTTNQALWDRPLSSVYDKSMDQSHCYDAQEMVYQAEEGEEVQLGGIPSENQINTQMEVVENSATKAPADKAAHDCGCGCSGAGNCQLKKEEKKLLFLLAGILAVVIIIKICKK